MFQQERIANVHVLLEKIGDFLDESPANEKVRVDWQEFSERRKSALKSLDLLYRMFGQMDVTYACSEGKPEPRNNRLDVTCGCSEQKPEPKNSRFEVSYV